MMGCYYLPASLEQKTRTGCCVLIFCSCIIYCCNVYSHALLSKVTSQLWIFDDDNYNETKEERQLRFDLDPFAFLKIEDF